MTITLHYKTSDGKMWALRNGMNIKDATRSARELLRKTNKRPTVTEVTLKRIDATP